MTHKLYLTIDDAPSSFTKDKVRYLQDNAIPAIFYCRGEYIEKYPEGVIATIQAGFLVGNHSYSHPHFSKIPVDECFKEILKTEDLINACYYQAGAVRSKKIIRLPFGDRGTPETAPLIQDFLIQHGFEAIQFSGLDDSSIDAPWTLDPQDYKSAYIDNPESYIPHFQTILANASDAPQILILHDFDRNHHLFKLAMKHLKELKFEFLSPTCLD